MLQLTENEYCRSIQLEGRQAIWIVELSSGEKAYQDEGGWKSLGQNLRLSGKKIEKLFLKFRSHVVEVCFNFEPEGWYFSQSVFIAFGTSQQAHLINVGALKGDTVYLKRFFNPELELFGEETRAATNTPCLIRNDYQRETIS